MPTKANCTNIYQGKTNLFLKKILGCNKDTSDFRLAGTGLNDKGVNHLVEVLKDEDCKIQSVE